MCKRIFLILLSATLAGALCSCSKRADDTISLTSEQVATILGIKGEDGLEVGDVVSGPEGVTVKSVSFNRGDSTEIEVRDIDLRITSPTPYVYVNTSFGVGSLDVLDWKTRQRARATGIRVEKPGDHFFTKLESAVSAARSGGGLRTAGLSCDRLSIDRVDYEIRSSGGDITRVRIDALAIDQAKTDTLGTVSIAQVSVDNVAAGKGLKVTQVDRAWIDQVLAMLAISNSPATQPAAVPGAPVLATRVLPFDHLEVAEVNVELAQSLGTPASPDPIVPPGPGSAKVTGLQLDVRRGPDGQFAGLSGSVDLSVATSAFGGAGREFFREMDNSAIEESVAGSLAINMTFDPVQQAEQSTISLAAPGLLSLTASATTRKLPQLLELLLTRQPISDRLVTISSLSLQGSDQGLIAFMESDRYKGPVNLQEIVGMGPSMFRMGRPGAQLVPPFDISPNGVSLTLQSKTFLDLGDFFGGVLALMSHQLFNAHLPAA